MAFGFGFNKQKALTAAEKFVQQGKLQNAISEYEKVLKADPKDLTVMNTVGDLYARIGNTDKAIECFKSVGDAYASQGFTVKAIAMYKKLTKLKSALETVLRLAELYTQQGLFNDARAQYLQVAEEFLRENQFEQAVRIFQKTLEMDPDNVAMRTRLAEVYLRLGKNQEAWQIFSAAAESLRSKGQLNAADEILRRMLQLDAGNSEALLLRGKNAFESGNIAGAAQQLEKVADLDSHPDGLKTLLQAYLHLGDLAQAGTLAEKLLTIHNDADGFLSYIEALIADGKFEQVLRLYQQHADRFLAGNCEKVLRNLHMMIGHVRENTVALEMLLELLSKAGENTHLTEIYELLAHGYVQSGDLQKAQTYYLKLTQLEPENQLHAKSYQQVVAKLGPMAGPRGITAQEGAAMVDELEATSPFIDQRHDDDVELAVRAALTDAELFTSYNMPAKALGPLLLALPRAPRDLRINQRLAALLTRDGQFAEAAACCRTLESIYHDAGYPNEAARYSQLAIKYEECVSIPVPLPAVAPVSVTAATPALPPPDFAVTSEIPHMLEEADASALAVTPNSASPVEVTPDESAPRLFFHAPKSPAPAETALQTDAAPAPEASTEISANEPSTKEIDLSAEWEGAVSEGPSSEAIPKAEPTPSAIEAHSVGPDPQALSEIIEEIRFYLNNHMVEEARTAFAKLEQLDPEPYVLDGIRDAMDAAIAPPATAEAAEAQPVPPVETQLSVAEPETVAQPEFAASEPAADAAPAEPVAPPEPETVEVTSTAAGEPVPPNLDEFVSELDASLGDSFHPHAPEAPQSAPDRSAWPQTAPAQPMPAMPPAPLVIPPAAPMIGISASASGSAAAVAPALDPETPSTPPLFTYQPSQQRWLGEPSEAPSPDSTRIDLIGMFGELKNELEQDEAAGDNDPETHYNLGVGFREMGLLEEAIGEFQKVCQSIDRGVPFPQTMQAYTWLAQCFLDKGLPEAAVRWYEKALKIPGIDGEAQTALHYEIASAHEAAGHKSAALNHFTEVYASNIDYRGVAERIQALKS